MLFTSVVDWMRFDVVYYGLSEHSSWDIDDRKCLQENSCNRAAITKCL